MSQTKKLQLIQLVWALQEFIARNCELVSWSVLFPQRFLSRSHRLAQLRVSPCFALLTSDIPSNHNCLKTSVLWKGGTYFLKTTDQPKLAVSKTPPSSVVNWPSVLTGHITEIGLGVPELSQLILKMKIFDQTELGIVLHGFSERFTQHPNQEKYYQSKSAITF